MISIKVFCAVVVSVLIAGACGGGGDDAPVASATGCDPIRSAPNGVTEYSLEHEGSEIPYFVAVPESYDGSKLSSLQILLPGATGRAEPAAAGWGPTLLRADAVVAVADINGPGRSVAVVEDLIRTLIADYCVDERTVGLIGSSSSGPFTVQLAQASDLVAAMVVGIGAFDAPAEVQRQVPVMAWGGRSDRSVVDRSVASWVAAYGCDPETPGSEVGDVITFTYEGCETPLVYHFVPGMGHKVPSHWCPPTVYCHETESLDILEAAAEFFAANPLAG